MNKTKRAAIAILSKAFVVQGIMVSSTVLAEISASFPEASLTGIQMIMNLCMLAAFPMNIITGALCNRIQKRYLSVLAVALMACGGLLPVVFNTSIYFLYLSSILIGVAQGTMYVLMPTITTELFEGDARSKMFGITSAVENFGSIVIMLLAGWLAPYGWERAYLSFLLVLVALAAVVIFMPKMDIPRQKKEEKAQAESEKKVPVPGRAIAISLIGSLFFIGYATFVLNASIYIANTGVGDASLAALSLSAGTVAGVLAGLVFHPLLKAIKWHVITFAALITAGSYLVLVLYSSVFSVYLAGTLSGGAFALAVASLNQIISEICTEEQVAGAMGFSAACTSAGAFSSPFIINPLSGLFAGAGEGAVFLASVVFLAAVMVLMILWIIPTMPKVRRLNAERKAAESAAH